MVADDQRICTAIECHPCVIDILNPFQDQLATPKFFDPGYIIPVQTWIKLRGSPFAELAHIADALNVTDNIAKLTI